ncbi:MAG: 2-phosphosulfolactate phosphatase [Ekhidna sp.]|nr:2-phosphosulfolactate phosphatase [Ekhidna sp.]
MKTIEVCLTPELIHQHDLKGKVIVVADIFRATSCIVTGLAAGVKSIRPVGEIEEVKALARQGYIMAGERGGKKVDGFDMGNSPFAYQNTAIKAKKVAISTTNGSAAILKSVEASQVLIGAFLNLESVMEYLIQLTQSVVIHCAGWRGTPNLEDTLFAGALMDEVMEEFTPLGDSASIAHQLYISTHENLSGTALGSSHAKRLINYGMEEDLAFCMETNKYSVVPKLVGEELVI